MNGLKAIGIAGAVSVLGTACAESPEQIEAVGEAAQAVHGSTLDVAFSDCVESVGVTLVDTNSARDYLPAGLVLVGEGTPVTPLVVRTARCEGIAVDGHNDKPGTVVQIGAVIVPPDFTGDINNYTFWYATTHKKLAKRLSDLGVDAEHVANIDYELELGAGTLPFHVKVPKPSDARLELSGTVVAPSAPVGSFLANWWQEESCGTGLVKMSTNVPAIAIGSANLTLTTKATSDLGELVGGDTAGFPALQQFNVFASASMHVELTP